jgi:hypothetical protein
MNITRARLEVLAEEPAAGHRIGAPPTDAEVRELARRVIELESRQARKGALMRALVDATLDAGRKIYTDAELEDIARRFERAW